MALAGLESVFSLGGGLPTAARGLLWDVNGAELRNPSTSALVRCDERPKGEGPPTLGQGRSNSPNLGRRSQVFEVAILLVSRDQTEIRGKVREDLGDEHLGECIATSMADRESVVVAIHAFMRQDSGVVGVKAWGEAWDGDL